MRHRRGHQLFREFLERAIQKPAPNSAGGASSVKPAAEPLLEALRWQLLKGWPQVPKMLLQSREGGGKPGRAISIEIELGDGRKGIRLVGGRDSGHTLLHQVSDAAAGDKHQRGRVLAATPGHQNRETW